MTGLILTNKSNFFRILNIADSGLISKSTESHLGPPTAPNKIASTSSQTDMVSSGRGVPTSSIAIPPILPSINSN